MRERIEHLDRLHDAIGFMYHMITKAAFVNEDNEYILKADSDVVKNAATRAFHLARKEWNMTQR